MTLGLIQSLIDLIGKPMVDALVLAAALSLAGVAFMLMRVGIGRLKLLAKKTETTLDDDLLADAEKSLGSVQAHVEEKLRSNKQ